MIPGTSCLATIVLSLRDKSHSPIEAPDNYHSAYGVKPGLNGAKIRLVYAVYCLIAPEGLKNLAQGFNPEKHPIKRFALTRNMVELRVTLAVEIGR